ncbi:MAG TPA: hypothetical protein VGK33_03070 [Chloroflexota bacterium]
MATAVEPLDGVGWLVIDGVDCVGVAPGVVGWFVVGVAGVTVGGVV